MAAVILHWDLPAALQDRFAAKKLFIRWSHTCKAFGIHDLVLIDVDGLNPAYGDAELNISVVGSLEDAVAMFPQERLVYVEEGGDPLAEFTHPEDAVYVFGSDFGELSRADVSLDTQIPLNAEMACAILLHDRVQKCH